MYRLGRISDSVMLLRKALEINNKEPISYYTMGTNLVAMNNITGAVEFFRQLAVKCDSKSLKWRLELAEFISQPYVSYALYLNPDYIEAFQCLFINKCVLLREKNNLKPPSDTKSNGDNHMFWEKAWKVLFRVVLYSLLEAFFQTIFWYCWLILYFTSPAFKWAKRHRQTPGSWRYLDHVYRITLTRKRNQNRVSSLPCGSGKRRTRSNSTPLPKSA